jgi:hypothetical protein
MLYTYTQDYDFLFLLYGSQMQAKLMQSHIVHILGNAKANEEQKNNLALARIKLIVEKAYKKLDNRCGNRYANDKQRETVHLTFIYIFPMRVPSEGEKQF